MEAIGDIRVKGRVALSIKRATISTKVCSHPECIQRTDLHVVPLKTRKSVLKYSRFYIPKLLTACSQHLNYETWMPSQCDAGQNLFTVEQIEDMVDMLRLEPKPGENIVTGLTSDLENEMKRNTGLSMEQFDDLLSKLPLLLTLFHNNRARASCALYIYLMKMRTGLPNADVGNRFHITRVTVCRQMQKVREAMREDFIFNYVNYIRSREDLIELNTGMSRGLFCNETPNRAAIICDGTYIYINKSSNYDFQKKTYNEQKKRNFIKVMMCVACNGEVIYTFGPYPATQNDASILKSIFETSDAFDGLQRGDMLILDRGFRDCVNFLQAKGIDVQMPHLIQKSDNKRQLSTINANHSRFVTAIRFVVEARNGHLKTIFKIFDNTWNTPTLKYLHDDIQICCALINCYFRKIESNKDIAEEISQRMVDKLNTPNDLSRIINLQSFQNNMKDAQVFEAFEDLPSLSEQQLLRISFGRYQIKQAASYCQEHMRAHEGSFQIFSVPENILRQFFISYYDDDRDLVLLYCCFKSRFVSGKKHRTYVLIDLNERGENVVIQHCCSCYSGLRTVGCCSHIMCMIWFTLHIKNRNIPRPAAFIDDYFTVETR